MNSNKEYLSDVTNLIISDHETDGRPVLAPDSRARLVAAIKPIVVNPDAVDEYVSNLQKQINKFRHTERLQDEQMEAVVTGGPDALDDSGLAKLLLNPIALYALYDAINERLPDAWMETLRADVRDCPERFQSSKSGAADITVAPDPQPPPRGVGSSSSAVPLDLTIGAASSPGGLFAVRAAAATEPRGVNCWLIGFGDDAASVRRRIAEHAFGDPEHRFEIRIYRLPVPGRTDLVQAQLEIEPVPMKNDLELVVEFRVGGKRQFRVEVPPELRRHPTAEPRPRTRTAPSEPLPAAAFDLQGGGEWLDEAWPAELILRSSDSQAFGSFVSRVVAAERVLSGRFSACCGG